MPEAVRVRRFGWFNATFSLLGPGLPPHRRPYHRCFHQPGAIVNPGLSGHFRHCDPDTFTGLVLMGVLNFVILSAGERR